MITYLPLTLYHFITCFYTHNALFYYTFTQVIDLACMFLDRIGVLPKTKLIINTLGDHESRVNYESVLSEYFRGHYDNLSDDSKLRYIS